MRSAGLCTGRQCALPWPCWTLDLATSPSDLATVGVWWVGCVWMSGGQWEMRFQSNCFVRRMANTHSDSPLSVSTGILNVSGRAQLLSSLVLAGKEHNWGNDRLWLHGFGSESDSEAGERDRQQHHVYLFTAELLRQTWGVHRSDDVLIIKPEKMLQLWAGVLSLFIIVNKGMCLWLTNEAFEKCMFLFLCYKISVEPTNTELF